MTLPEAHETARNAAVRFGNTWRVFRLPGWPPAVYSAIGADLPPQAIVLATYPVPETADPPPAPLADPQGSLFS